jgi:hypothetical protein
VRIVIVRVPARPARPKVISMTAPSDIAIRRALEAAGVEFIEENGGGPGVRLKKRTRPKSTK